LPDRALYHIRFTVHSSVHEKRDECNVFTKVHKTITVNDDNSSWFNFMPTNSCEVWFVIYFILDISFHDHAFSFLGDCERDHSVCSALPVSKLTQADE
jgi:hypothetical protein